MVRGFSPLLLTLPVFAPPPPPLHHLVSLRSQVNSHLVYTKTDFPGGGVGGVETDPVLVQVQDKQQNQFFTSNTEIFHVFRSKM